MTPTGKSAGNCGKRSCNASGPPVEVPIATISGTTRKWVSRVGDRCVVGQFIGGSHTCAPPWCGVHLTCPMRVWAGGQISRTVGKRVLHGVLYRQAEPWPLGGEWRIEGRAPRPSISNAKPAAACPFPDAASHARKTPHGDRE